MSTPDVSIIIPCYNVEKYFVRCMNTIVNQTLKNIEIILVDDASPDGIPVLCDEWCKKDTRIKVIHKKVNEGLGFARNSGLEIASGRYVAFVDSDDFVSFDMYRRLYEASDGEKMDAVLCGLEKETVHGGLDYIHDYDSTCVFSKAEMHRLAMSFLHGTELSNGKRLFMSVWHGIYKRETIEKYGLRFYSERDILSEDLPFQVSFFVNANEVKFIPDYLYTYCHNLGSLSNKFKVSKFDTATNLRQLLYKIVPKTDYSSFFIDIEYYGRVRYLLSDLVFADNISWNEKYNTVKRLCKNQIWRCLNLRLGQENYSWKFIRQYKLLCSNMSLPLLLFVIFDKKINKRSLCLKKGMVN